MAGHPVIVGYLQALARRLPADVVDELADGLEETYRAGLARGRHPDDAARAAVAEFGEPDVVIAGFVALAPGRRAARALLCWGPLVGSCWGLALVTGRAWTWPLPNEARPAFGLVLLAVVAALVGAATGQGGRRRARMALGAVLGLVGLVGALVIAALTLAPALTGFLAVAVLASAARLAFAVRVVPRLVAPTA